MLQGDLAVLRDDGQNVFSENSSPQHRIRNLVCVLALGDQGFSASELKPLIWRPKECSDQTSALTSLIYNARRVLPPGRLITSPPGKGPRRYSLLCQDSDIDVACFLLAVGKAERSRANGRLEESARHYAQAASLWPTTTSSARALPDFPRTRLMLQIRDRLLAHRREVAEAYAETQLRLGRHTASLADEILQSIRAHPTNTRLWRLHIIALYRAGYKGDALRADEAVRTLFEDEFQAGPGTGMDQLQAQVLADDPVLWTDAALQESTPGVLNKVSPLNLASTPIRGARASLRPHTHLNRDVTVRARELAGTARHTDPSTTSSQR
ncbi:AfsR/SARP family transcriptional regulator [Spirillospora sp. CA-128828]|uniref:AfsR/SARP family transcriptional regulator n=1 Tax=Spirillospora sp. CA-128828 TaxID=3240033 RepID=UPI003D903FF0